MKKILLVGPEVTDFLNPLARKLKALGYTVDVLETRKIPRHNTDHMQSYSTILDYHEISRKKIKASDIFKYLLKFEFYNNFIRQIFINCLESKCGILKSLKNSFNHQHLKEIFSPILNNYDIINFHSLTPGLLLFVDYINPDKKIILSYWGSDLFQIWGWDIPQEDELKNYYVESKAIKRADIITVHNYEMERAVIAKFGPGIKNKIVLALFGMNDKIFELIDKYRKAHPNLVFLNKYGIPEIKIKITIGYSGDPICNHLQILDELNKIEKNTREKIHLLVPMTYGNYSSEYKEEVVRMLNQTKISYTLFDKFLSIDELAKLRLASDIMIQMSKSDALSVSVCEALYADNLLISAVWLPYSSLRSEKIFFYETDFLKLGETITYAANNYEAIRVSLSNNPDRIKKLNGFDNTFPKWSSLLNSLS